MSFSIRIATKDDITELVELRIELLQEVRGEVTDDCLDTYRDYLGNYFQKHLIEDTFLAWLAVDEQETIIASSSLAIIVKQPQLWNLTGEESYIFNMYTKPEWRRKGIGKILLEKLLEESKKRGIKKVTLHATPVGRLLYEKYGFKNSESTMILYLE